MNSTRGSTPPNPNFDLNRSTDLNKTLRIVGKPHEESIAKFNCHTCFSEENQVHTYMHARIMFDAYSDIKVNTETVSRKTKKDYQRFTLYPGNEGSKHHRQSTGGCIRLALHNIFTSSSCSFLLLSNIVYSKGEHLSYSASVGKV
jgi:hypothetical protein